MTSEAPRIPIIDALRGIAALGVVAFHLRPEHTFWMWSMVDLFFVISGLVITRLLLEVPQLDWPRLRNFWLRRAIRIWPVYYLTLIATLALATALYNAGWVRNEPYSEGIWKFFVFVQFTELYEPGRSVKEMSHILMFFHSWSLAVEEQYYLVWPFVVAALRRHAIWLGAVCIALIAVGVGSRTLDLVPLTLITRVDGLAMGSLLALALHRYPDMGSQRRPTTNLTLGLLALPGLWFVTPFLITGYFGPYTHLEMFYDYPLAGVIFGFDLLFVTLIAFLILNPQCVLAARLCQPILIYFGSISFAVYMFHQPILGAYKASVKAMGMNQTWWLDIFYVALVIGLAHLSREHLEKRVNKLKSKLPMSSASPSQLKA